MKNPKISTVIKANNKPHCKNIKKNKVSLKNSCSLEILIKHRYINKFVKIKKKKEIQSILKEIKIGLSEDNIGKKKYIL